MIPALHGFRSVAAKELIHIRRDATTLVFALMIPAMQLTLLGFAVDFDVRHVRSAIVDLDRSRESRTYLTGIQNTQYIDFVETLHSPQEAEDALRRGEVRAAVVIPADFARKYGTSTPPQVYVMLDGSDSQVANPARNAFRKPPTVPTSTVSPDAVGVRVNVLFNPEIRTQIYTIPGLLGVILQMVTVTLTSFSLVREREQGTLEQLMVSPVGKLGLMLGKLLPYAFLALFEMATVIFLARLMLNIRISGNLLLLVVLAVPFILASLSMGLLISTVAKNQAQAMQMSMLTLLPSILLSGYITPRETMPLALYLLGNVFPVTYFIQIIRGIMVRGAVMSDLVWSVVPLCVLMVLLITAATAKFRKSVE